MTDIGEVVKKYISLRDEQATIGERHKAEMAPYNEQMEVIEKWLLKEMEKMGVDSLKTPSGTPYKAVTKSVKMSDPQAFKDFVFADAVTHISSIMGEGFDNIVKQTLLDDIKWDMIDFRAGKKGIQEYATETGAIPPGVTIDQFTTINIRRA